MSTADFLGNSGGLSDQEDMDHDGEESEAEGGTVDLMGNDTGGDSSEEQDEGSDAEREVRKGQFHLVYNNSSTASPQPSPAFILAQQSIELTLTLLDKAQSLISTLN